MEEKKKRKQHVIYFWHSENVIRINVLFHYYEFFMLQSKEVYQFLFIYLFITKSIRV